MIDHLQFVLERLEKGVRIPSTAMPELRVRCRRARLHHVGLHRPRVGVDRADVQALRLRLRRPQREVAPQGVHKGAAILAILGHLGIDPADAIGVGDNWQSAAH